MSMIPIKNDGKMPRHIGGLMIPPGETRLVAEHHVPGYLRPQQQAAEPQPETADFSKQIEEILGHSVANMEEILSSLSLDELNQVEAAENAKPKPRQNALAAFAAERIRRASEIVEGNDTDLDAFAELVASMGEDELAKQDYPDAPSLQAVVDNERQQRELKAFRDEMAEFSAEDLAPLKETYKDQPDYLAILDELITEKAKASGDG